MNWINRFRLPSLRSLVPQSWTVSRDDSQHASESPDRYINMLLDTEKVPLIDNILAATFCWILLAGYLVFPGTFTSLQTSASLKEASDANNVGRTAYEAVQNVSLLGIAATCCFVGLCGASWLYYHNKQNYVWIGRKIFLWVWQIPIRKKGHLTLSRPVLINSATGFVNTLINVYTARAKTWSVTATVTAAVTGFFAVLSGILFIFYNNYLLAKLQKDFNTNTGK